MRLRAIMVPCGVLHAHVHVRRWGPRISTMPIHHTIKMTRAFARLQYENTVRRKACTGRGWVCQQQECKRPSGLSPC